MCRFIDDDHVRLVGSTIILCFSFFMLQGKVVLADESLAKVFLGPNTGFTTILENSNGLTMQLKISQIEGTKQFIEQEICCFQTPPKEVPRSILYLFNLRAEGSRLILLDRGIESTLLDLDSDNWTIPIEVHPSLEEASSSPTLAQCSISSRGYAQLMSKEREVIVVECKYTIHDLPETVVRHSFASGLGLVQLYDFKLNGLDE